MRSKTPWTFALIAILAIWPAVHHVFMQHNVGDQWKLFGWSMYTTRPPSRSLFLYGLVDGQFHQLTEVHPEVGEAAHTYLRWYNAFGHAASSERVAEAARRTMDGIEGLAVEMVTVSLVTETATFEEVDRHREIYVFEDTGPP